MSKKRKRIFIWISRRGALRGILSLAMLAALYVFFTEDFGHQKVWDSWALPLSGKIIAIDAGHGGVDGGAESADGLMEKNINLNVSLYLRDYLQQAGALVVMTREVDKDLAAKDTKGLSRRKTEDLLNRVRFIKQKNADFLVSIHLNSIPSSRWHGAQTFFYPGNAEGEESKRLATLIQSEIKSSLGNTDRMANTVNSLYLLKTSNIPSTLVELGFLSNPTEAALLHDANYQKKMASAIYRGILRYSAGDPIGSS